MISILVSLLILVIVVSVIFWVLSLFPLPAPWNNIARAIVGLIILIWLLSYLLPMAGHPLLR
jgi:hypothetical protein